MVYKFTIEKNNFLKKDTIAYYHQDYTGYQRPGNPDFLNTLKNTFNNEKYSNLVEAMNKVVEIIKDDIPIIIKETNISNWMIVCVPRAKALNKYSSFQLMFKEAVEIAAKHIKGVTDGTDCIKRVIDTKTTHIRNPISIPNDGDNPYPGITNATCRIDKNKILNKNVILIDDIYTKTVNIDEDCIQALLDNGANKVIFYSIGYTRRNV